MNESTRGRVRFRDVLGVRPFRALWLSQIQSLAGDQLARVALSVLVFSKTGSAALTALIYALTFAPALLGGVLLGGLADRLPRRSVMIVADLVRAVLVGVMALPHMPLAALGVLVAVVVLVEQPFVAAEAAILPDLLVGEQYVVGAGLRMLTSQAAQLAGFALGGVVVAALGVRTGLAIDAATFLISAGLIAAFVRDSGWSRQPGSHFRLADAADAVRFVWNDMTVRMLIGMAWLAAFHVVPEALAAPYVAALGGGPREVGLLMAAPPAGAALGAILVVRIPEERRNRLAAPLAALCGAPLAFGFLHPGFAVSLVLWFALGVLTAYQLVVTTLLVRSVPDDRRGRVFGLDSAGMVGGQGIGALVFGIFAQHASAAAAIATAGLVAFILGIVLAVRFRAHPATTSGVGDGAREAAPTPAA